MPLYEFDCDECHHPFDELVRNSEAIERVACPSCGSKHVTKKVSAFAARSNGDSSFPSAASCNPVGT